MSTDTERAVSNCEAVAGDITGYIAEIRAGKFHKDKSLGTPTAALDLALTMMQTLAEVHRDTVNVSLRFGHGG
jgi:hypothetical protein